MPFAVPIVLREPKDHTSDCYLKKTGISSKSRHTVIYPNLPSATRPVPQSGEFLVPKPPKNLTFSDNNSDSDEDHGQQEDNVYCNPTFEASCSPTETY
jgi:hypothetical protein